MNVLVIGASAGLGAALANRLAALGHNLYLIASDEQDLAPTAQDLKLRHGVAVKYRAVDLMDIDAIALKDGILAEMESIEAIFYVAGYGAPEADCGVVESDRLERLIMVNFTAAVRIINAFLDHLTSHPVSNLVGIGSVATMRGRGKNIVYGSAKQGLEFYFSAIRHAYQGHPMKTQFYRVGFMQTSMLGENKSPLPAADPDWMAERIVKGMHKDSGPRYLPSWWGVIALILKLLPWSIFRKLNI